MVLHMNMMLNQIEKHSIPVLKFSFISLYSFMKEYFIEKDFA